MAALYHRSVTEGTAVTEEFELRELTGATAPFRLAWRSAERIAAIADVLLIPPFITEWIRKKKRAQRG